MGGLDHMTQGKPIMKIAPCVGISAVLLLGAISCHKKPVPPPEKPDYVTTLMAVSTTVVSDKAGTPLNNPFQVRVIDENGTPVAGVPINFEQITPQSGSRLLPAATTTDPNGYAGMFYVLDTLMGVDTLRATASGVDDSVVYFQITVTMGPADGVVMVSPLAYPVFDTAGTRLPDTFVVKVVDRYNNGIPNHRVLFKTSNRCVVVTDSTALLPFENDSVYTRTDDSGLARAVWQISVKPYPGFGYPNSFNLVAKNEVNDSVRFLAASYDPGRLEYYYDVRPIFQSRCFICHPSVLTDYSLNFYYTTVVDGIVEPGDSLNSLLLAKALSSHGPSPINMVEEDIVFRWVVTDSAAPGSSGLNCYQSQMKSIIDSKCLACHGEPPAGNSYIMTTHESIRAIGSGGLPNAIAGDSSSALVQHLLPGGDMRVYLAPDSAVLADSLIRWIVIDSLRQY